MIVSKPKGNTLFALSMFLLICFTLLGYTLYNYFNNEVHHWYQYVIFVVVTPVSFAVLIKTIKSYKIVRLGKGRLSVDFPFLFKSKVFNMQDLVCYSEDVIKTQGSDFKELTIKFDRDKVKLTNQENSEYSKIYAYLKKKHPRKLK